MLVVFRFPATLLIVGAFVSIVALPSTTLCAADDGDPLSALLDAAARRLRTADPVAAAKFKSGAPLDDPAREQQEIDAVTTAAEERGIDAEYVKAAFRRLW